MVTESCLPLAKCGWIFESHSALAWSWSQVWRMYWLMKRDNVSCFRFGQKKPHLWMANCPSLPFMFTCVAEHVSNPDDPWDQIGLNWFIPGFCLYAYKVVMVAAARRPLTSVYTKQGPLVLINAYNNGEKMQISSWLSTTVSYLLKTING